ncbi:metal ABC transporter permease [Arcobacter sp. FWKO B]|uniref:metal ABC transporter permease n=1 Tax=Arcobacter sp. FWKO B TaxID=2593672 RepID=UPI0018A4AF94|nr:metal ABC transporter permease [Arcobacter sp. FWKO B]QOG12052.1 metal ABC transporter permease [Arcobacter sp. FWKO B]
MVEMLEFTFMQNALLAGLLIAIAVGVVGTLVVVNKMTFLAGGIAHSSYGGIGIAIFFGLPILLSTSIFALICAGIIAFLTIKQRQRVDALIGVIWAGGMALGIMLVDMTSGYNVDLMSYLFGSILAVSSEDILFILGVDILILFVVFLFYKELLAVSYDSEFATLRGISVKVFYTLMLLLATLTVVAAIRVVGLILVIALLTIPTYIAENFVNRLSHMMILSTILAIMFTIVGLIVSYFYDLSSGASIIMVAILALVVVKVFYAVK